MPTLLELREKRASAWAQAKEFNERADAGGELSAEDEKAWRSALADIDSLGDQIETREKTEELDQRFAQIDADTTPVSRSGVPSAEDEYRSTFERFLRFGTEGLDQEQRQLLQSNSSQIRAQAVGSGSAGGYTVPQGFWAKVTETMKAYGSVANVSESHNTATGNDLPWPTNDDTGNMGAILAENTQITQQDLTFGQKTLKAHTYTSKLILASLQFMQDSEIDAEGFIARKVGERLARIHNVHFTVGTGTAQPQGVITGATVGKTAASATAIVFDELIDLEASVDAAYRNDAMFMFHDLSRAHIRKIKDTTGQYIWQPSVQAGVPDTLLGYRCAVNNDMATIATGAKSVAFGNFRAGYVTRFAKEMALMRLAERYADYLQVGFFGFDRADGLVQDASAVKVLQQA